MSHYQGCWLKSICSAWWKCEEKSNMEADSKLLRAIIRLQYRKFTYGANFICNSVIPSKPRHKMSSQGNCSEGGCPEDENQRGLRLWKSLVAKGLSTQPLVLARPRSESVLGHLLTVDWPSVSPSTPCISASHLWNEHCNHGPRGCVQDYLRGCSEKLLAHNKLNKRKVLVSFQILLPRGERSKAQVKFCFLTKKA